MCNNQAESWARAVLRAQDARRVSFLLLLQ